MISGQFTLFAPTDEAFNNIPKWAGKLPLKEVLRFHVGRGLIYKKDFQNDLLIRSLLPKRDIRLNFYKVTYLARNKGWKFSPNWQFLHAVM